MLKNNWILSLAIVLCMSCSVVQAPKGAVPNRVNTKMDAFGAWIIINNSLEGELIAINKDSIYTLSFGNQFKSFYKPDVTYVRIIIHRNSANDYIGWGAAFSLLNTILLSGAAQTFYPELITFAVAGFTANTEANKRINYLDFPQFPWEEISKFARFPQGLPLGLETQKLRNRIQFMR